MQRLVFCLAAILLAGPAWAGTSLKSNLPPIVATCQGGGCYNAGTLCSANADCDFGTLSPKSKASLSGDGRLKVQLKGVLDAMGNPGSGDYILNLYLVNLIGASQMVDVKVTVADGKGKADVDLSAFMGSVGDGIELFDNYLYSPPDVPGDCPGANTAADIIARQGDGDCVTGVKLGQIGVDLAKTKFKSNVVPEEDLCDGNCIVNFASCTTNADCNFGSLSPKSKASLGGDGRLKIQLKGVVDSTAMPVSGDYILLLSLYGFGSAETVTVKVTVADGSGKADVDLSSFLALTIGGSVQLKVPRIYTPPAIPGDCPGANTAMDIASRQGDLDCLSGKIIGAMGVTRE